MSTKIFFLQVSTDIEGKNEWKECFSVKGVRLPTGFYIGASAATGELAGKRSNQSLSTDFNLDYRFFVTFLPYKPVHAWTIC